MTTQTVTRPESDKTLDKKIQRLREVYSTGPEVGKTALEKVLGELTSFASTTRARVESAGRTGVRQGKGLGAALHRPIRARRGRAAARVAGVAGWQLR